MGEQRAADGHVDDARGDVHQRARRAGAHVDAVHAAGARRLGVQRVAGRLERGQAVVAGQDVVEQQLDLLLVGEGVERAGLELGEGVVVGREEGEPVVRVLELAGDLLGYPGGIQQAEQRRVLPAVFQDARQVELRWWWAWARSRGGVRRCRCCHCQEEREEEKKWEEDGVAGH